MIIPLLTYSSAIKTTYTRTQLTKLDSLERSASKIIGGTTPAKSILGSVEKQVCSLVKTCLKKEIGHPSFDDYFTVLSRRKRTRNKNLTLKLPTIKLEVSKPIFYFGAAKIFNQLPVSEREFLI